MRAAPPDSPSTTAPTQDPPPGDATATIPPPRHRPLWPLPLFALLGWFLGLAPWFVARRTVGTFGTPWNPRNDMRQALLPFHHERLTLLLTVVLLGGALAGLAPWWLAPRRGRRFVAAALVVLTTALALAGSVAQTLSLRPDLGGTGSTEATVRAALVLLAAAGAAGGLLLGLLASLGGRALRTLAVAPLAVVTASWVGLLVTLLTADSSDPARLGTLPTALVVLTGVLVGVGMGCGPRPSNGLRGVLVALLWSLALGLAWLTRSALTAVRYFLENAARGNRVDAVELRELARDVGRIFVDTLSVAHAPWREAAVAVVVGVAAILLRTAARTRAGGDGTPG